MAKWFRRKKQADTSEPLAAWGDPSTDAPPGVHDAAPIQPASDPTDAQPPESEAPDGPWIAFFHAVGDPDEAGRVRAFALSFGEPPRCERFGVRAVGCAQDDLTQILLTDDEHNPRDIAAIAEQWLQLIRTELKPQLNPGDYLGLSLPDPDGGSRVLTVQEDPADPRELLIERTLVDVDGEAHPISAS